MMDLDCKSQPYVDLSKQLNRIDKLTSKLALTLKDIPPQQIIPQRTKDHIVTQITNDHARSLIRILDKQVITWDRQLGAKGTRWNIIHLCAKFNAVNSARVLLKQLYQRDPEEYLNGVNSETAEGFTPLMVSIIYRGDKVLELLLQLGGVDLSKIQRGKLRAYDLALHYRNQFAISQLIVYEDKCRKKDYINEQELFKSEPMLDQKPSVWDSVSSYLLDCLICFKYEEQQDQKFFAKMNPFKKDNDQIDAVKVGSRRDIEDYEIQWRKISSINGQRIALFDSFKPQDICESQFSLKNNLILLQALSDFPWILRKVITRIETEQGSVMKYNVNLYYNCILNKLEVDECVPIVKERGQPMFLSNRSEIWPMILQKALAKVHGSYLSLNTISPAEALETITGFYVKQVPLISLADSHRIIPALQDLAHRGYLFLLQGRPRTQLNSGSEVNSYAVLNYYEKGSTRKILVSCPNVVQNWNEGKQIRQLTILKAHFSRINQSCIWIDQQKLDYFFTHATIVFTKQGSLRNDLRLRLKIKRQGDASFKKIDQNKQIGSGKEGVEQVPSTKQYSKSIFFKFKVQRRRDEPILLQITDLQTRDRFDLSQLVGWKDQGHGTITKEDEHSCCPELVKLLSIPGEYLCKFELKARKITPKRKIPDISKSIIKKKDLEEDNSQCRKKVQLNLGPEHLQEIQITTWSPEPLQLELLEEQFGTIQWLAHFRTFVNCHWDQLASAKQPFLTETANNKTIILAKKIPRKRLFVSIGSSYSENIVVQGKWSDELGQGHVQLQSDSEDKCAYCVLSGLEAETLQKAKIFVVDSD